MHLSFAHTPRPSCPIRMSSQPLTVEVLMSVPSRRPEMGKGGFAFFLLSYEHDFLNNKLKIMTFKPDRATAPPAAGFPKGVRRAPKLQSLHVPTKQCHLLSALCLVFLLSAPLYIPYGSRVIICSICNNPNCGGGICPICALSGSPNRQLPCSNVKCSACTEAGTWQKAPTLFPFSLPLDYPEDRSAQLPAFLMRRVNHTLLGKRALRFARSCAGASGSQY